ncbi:MAG: hypothetical protein N2688_03210 [Burkholderiaceae bacterium]|nr:hypothetical protein [Burkholderiaceae bacterium]
MRHIAQQRGAARARDLACNADLPAPAPPRFECRLTRRSEARLAPYSLDELLQGAAYAATVPPRLKQLFDTVRMQLELPGALHGRVIVQRQLMEDWTALLEVEAPQPVVAARLQVLPFVRQGPQLWAATALTRAHRQLICTVAPITVELLDGTRLILR